MNARLSYTMRDFMLGVATLCVMLVLVVIMALGRSEVSERGTGITAFSVTEAYGKFVESLYRHALGDDDVPTGATILHYQVFASAVNRLESRGLAPVIEAEKLGDDVTTLREIATQFDVVLRGDREVDPRVLALTVDGARDAVRRIAFGIERSNKLTHRQMLVALESSVWQIGLIVALFVAFAGLLFHRSLVQNRALTKKTRALAASETRLRELSHFRQQFLANMSHEFRTPLNAIQGFSQAILFQRDRMTRAQILDYVDVIERSSKDLGLLTENALDMSKIDAGRFDLFPRETDLSRLVQDAVTQQRGIAGQRGIDIGLHLARDWTVMCDEGSIKRCLINLLTNAVKFSGTGARVDVLVYRRPGRDLVIEVRDEGSGIPEQEVDMIFMAYARSSQVRRSRQVGAGLGLAIVKSLVDAHEGCIEVESTEGVGTTFRLCFPESMILAESAAPQDAPPLLKAS